ncbi:pyrroline-5-carboxylate reductase [Orrella marina]|uniref:Pyrroline-5-carboxylate reductase n=1 Tax=Orrella marina TaxID=2163011 RepID=A0A2R4XHK6_9BURK|nr:pyrroline-5-carboxylate reductase [Orrella marina]AWB33251.1 pyrroline-5-carboxylate reductase [Orrella marina]
MVEFPRIAFVGGGNMAGALIEGLLARGCPPSRLVVLDVHEPTRQKWQARGLEVLEGPDSSLTGCDVWLLAVKPQQLKEVAQAARPCLGSDTLVVSIAAGIALSSLCAWFGTADHPWASVIRAMPNTPALVGQGVTGLAAASGVTDDQRQLATQILSTVGEVVWVDSDDQIDAVTALSGSGPAYVFRFIEGMVAGGQKLGLSAQQSQSLAIATVAGAARLAAQSGDPVETLREKVTSKGGTTAAALDVMQQRQFLETLVAAMQAAHQRAGELSAEFGRTEIGRAEG